MRQRVSKTNFLTKNSKKILENDQNDLKIAKNGTKIVQNGLKCLGKWSKSGQESQTQIA